MLDNSKSSNKEKKSFEFKKRYIVYIIISTVIVAVVGALIINWLYYLGRNGNGYYTEWQASDALMFFATVLEALGTISLGAISIWQNIQLNKSNEKAQARLEEINNKSNEINTINKIVERENNRLENLIALSREFEDLIVHALNIDIFKNDININYEKSKILLDRIKLYSLHSNINRIIGIDILNLQEGLRLAEICDKVVKYTDSIYDDRLNIQFENYKLNSDCLSKELGLFFKEKNSYILDTQIKINSILIGDISLENLKETLNKCMEDVINGQTENAQ